MLDFDINPFPGMSGRPVNTRVRLDYGKFRLRICIESTLTKQQRRAIALSVIRAIAPLWRVRNSVVRHEDEAYRNVPHWMERPTTLAQAPSFETARERYGMRVRLARQARELTQVQAASILEMNVTHLSQLERGKHLPRPPLRKKIWLLFRIELESKVQNVASGVTIEL